MAWPPSAFCAGGRKPLSRPAPQARPHAPGHWLPRSSAPLALAAALVLLSLVWRTGLMLLTTAGCGLMGPHDHLLVGDAGPAELVAHLAAERACAERAAVDHQPALDARAGGRVFSLIETELAQSGLLLTLSLAVLGLLLFALQVPAALAQVHLAALSLNRSLTFPPPTPPPQLAWR